MILNTSKLLHNRRLQLRNGTYFEEFTTGILCVNSLKYENTAWVTIKTLRFAHKNTKNITDINVYEKIQCIKKSKILLPTLILNAYKKTKKIKNSSTKENTVFYDTQKVSSTDFLLSLLERAF